MNLRETFAVSLRKEKRRSVINGRRLKLGITTTSTSSDNEYTSITDNFKLIADNLYELYPNDETT